MMNLRILPLVWRELKVNTTTHFVVGKIIVPTAYLLLFSLGFSYAFNGFYLNGEHVPYTSFFLPGLIALQVFLNYSYALSMVRWDRITNLITIIKIAGVGMGEYLLSKVFSTVLYSMLQGVYLILLGAVFFGRFPTFQGFVYMLVGIFVGCVFWVALGVVLGIVITNDVKRDIITTLVGLPASFASSVFYPLNMVHSSIFKAIVLLNPLTYLAQFLRNAYLFGTFDTISFLILLVASGLLSLLSYYTARNV